MITTGILNLLYYFILLVGSPLLLFPDVSISPNVTAAITSASSYIHVLGIVLPVDTLITVLGLFLTIEVAVFTYKLIRWIYQKIPGIN